MVNKKNEDPFCYPYQCPYRLVSLFFFKWSYGAHFVFLTPVELRNPPNIYLVREKVWVCFTPKNLKPQEMFIDFIRILPYFLKLVFFRMFFGTSENFTTISVPVVLSAQLCLHRLLGPFPSVGFLLWGAFLKRERFKASTRKLYENGWIWKNLIF